MQKKQDIIDSKVKTIEETLSNTVTDLNSRLDQIRKQICKQLKEHSVVKQSTLQGTPSLQNLTRNLVTTPVSKALTSDRKFNPIQKQLVVEKVCVQVKQS